MKSIRSQIERIYPQDSWYLFEDDIRETDSRISNLEEKGEFARLIKNVFGKGDENQFLGHLLDLNLADYFVNRGIGVCHLESEERRVNTFGRTPEFKVSYEDIDYYLEAKRIGRPEGDSSFWRESNPLKKVLGKFDEPSEKTKNILVIERDVHSRYFEFIGALGIELVPKAKRRWIIVNGKFPKDIRNINVIIVLQPRGTGGSKIEKGAKYWRYGTHLINDFSYNIKIVNQEHPINRDHLDMLFPVNQQWLMEQ